MKTIKTMIHVKTYPEIRDAAQKIAKEIGLPLSTVINAYLRHFIKTKKVWLTGTNNMDPMKKFESDQEKVDLD